MEIALTVAKRSHDTQTQVGAVLVNSETGAILATGFNGFVRGAKDKGLPTVRPDKYKYIVHAEENLIANCVRHGVSTNDCILYCTLSPCVKCMRLLFQSGITSIIVKDLYRDVDDIKTMKDIQLDIEGAGDHPYHVLQYSV